MKCDVPGKLNGFFVNVAAMKKSKASSRAIEDAIVALLRERKGSRTICPSEVARRLAPKQWKTHMHSVREVAARLALEG